MTCYCQSSEAFEACCAPFLEGQNAPTALKLMRSRFSAFVCHNAAYILSTELSSLHEGVTQKSLEDSLKNQRYVHLEAKAWGEDFVRFRATFFESNRCYVLDEHSHFVHQEGRWWYAKALDATISELTLSRNDPCPCQSGKKFKKCCNV